ncbi:hypothetical protein B0H10DRAFT_1957853 [Mycena sp. CBHHK59/15]|nr:hypothetical protein B0H10DRAFT_1957853 [Mycena sp. CBHHK59/15]
MGPVRPHNGSGAGNQKLRGRIVQTCSRAACHWTCYHTEKSYIFEDAEAFVERYNARSVGAPVPTRFAQIPLRLSIPVDPPPSLNGVIHCHNIECKTAGGNRTRGSMQCIEFKCKKCCQNAANDAEAVHLPRDPCKNHGVTAVSDHQHLRGAAPAPNVAAATRPTTRRQPLAQPIGPLWRENHHAADEAKVAIDNLKARRLGMDAREKRTCEIVIYHTAAKLPLVISQYIDTFPRLQLSQLPIVVDALKLTATSVLDYWSGGGGWKIIDISSILTVENERRTLLKLRKSLLEELSLDDCVGLADELKRQPRVHGKKRGGQPDDLVSPLKKVGRPASNSAATDASKESHVVVVDDDPPASVPPTAVTPKPPVVVPAVQPHSRPVKSKPLRENLWIRNMSVSLWNSGWVDIKQLQDRDPRFKTELAAFPEIFGKPYHKQTVHKYKTLWRDVDEGLRDKYLAMGDVPTASWEHMLHEAKTYSPEEESGLSSLAPTPMVPDVPTNSSRATPTLPSHPATATAIDPPLATAAGIVTVPLSLSRATATPSRMPLGNLHFTNRTDPRPTPPLDTPLRPSGFFSDLGPLDFDNLDFDLPGSITPMTDEMFKGIVPNFSDSLNGNSNTECEFGLCFFCDEAYLVAPSAKLLEMLPALDDMMLSPTAANPNHRLAPQSILSRYCHQHREEAEALPLAQSHGWPQVIVYYDLQNRAKKSFVEQLEAILDDPSASSFFSEAEERVKESSQFDCPTAYFGEHGYYNIAVAIQDLLSSRESDIDPNLYQPLSFKELVEQVIIPEVQVLLISEDLDLPFEDAVDTLYKSTPFGRLFHSGISDRTRLTSYLATNDPRLLPPFPLEERPVAAGTFPVMSPGIDEMRPARPIGKGGTLDQRRHTYAIHGPWSCHPRHKCRA